MLTETAQAGKATGYIFNIDYSGYLGLPSLGLPIEDLNQRLVKANKTVL